VVLVSSLSCSVGVVLAFFSNEQTYNSLDDAQVTINSVADVGVDYINDTLNVRAACIANCSGSFSRSFSRSGSFSRSRSFSC